MTTEETELTFIRCPSCRSLVPAVAARCRMCGYSFDTDAGETAAEAAESAPQKKRPRVRQRTISASKEDVAEHLSGLEQSGLEQSGLEQSGLEQDAESEAASESEATREIEAEPREAPMTDAPAVAEELDIAAMGAEEAFTPSEEESFEPEPDVGDAEQALDDFNFDPLADSNEESELAAIEALEQNAFPDFGLDSSEPSSDEISAEDQTIKDGIESESLDAVRSEDDSAGEDIPAEEENFNATPVESNVVEESLEALSMPSGEQEVQQADAAGLFDEKVVEETDTAVVEQLAEESMEEEASITDKSSDDVVELSASAQDAPANGDGQPDDDSEEKPGRKKRRRRRKRKNAAGEDEAAASSVETEAVIEKEPEASVQAPIDENTRGNEKMATSETAIEETGAAPGANSAPAMSEAPAGLAADRATGGGVLIGWFVNFVQDGRGVAAEIRSGRFFVGRQRLRDSDMVISDSAISTPHCLVDATPGEGLKIQDLMSENGTHVMKHGSGSFVQVKDVVSVGHGDRIRLGAYEVMVCLVPDG